MNDLKWIIINNISNLVEKIEVNNPLILMDIKQMVKYRFKNLSNIKIDECDASELSYWEKDELSKVCNINKSKIIKSFEVKSNELNIDEYWYIIKE